MSLLDSWNQQVTVYPQETITDEDGNLFSRPSDTGISARVCLQHKGQSGTAARRVEDDDRYGFQTEQMYRMRFPRSFPKVLLPESKVEWMGQRWSVYGNPKYYFGSGRTAHVEYTLIRN